MTLSTRPVPWNPVYSWLTWASPDKMESPNNFWQSRQDSYLLSPVCFRSVFNMGCHSTLSKVLPGIYQAGYLACDTCAEIPDASSTTIWSIWGHAPSVKMPTTSMLQFFALRISDYTDNWIVQLKLWKIQFSSGDSPSTVKIVNIRAHLILFKLLNT